MVVYISYAVSFSQSTVLNGFVKHILSPCSGGGEFLSVQLSVPL